MADGFDRDDAGAAFGRGRDAGVESAAADGDNDGVDAGFVLQDLLRERARTGGDLRLVVGVAEQGSARVGVVDRRLIRLGVLGAGVAHIGAVLADPLDLDRRCGLGDEHGGADPEGSRRVGVSQPCVTTGRDDHPNRWIELTSFQGRKLTVEGTPGLEDPGVLQEFTLQPQHRFPQRGKQWGAPHITPGTGKGGEDIVSADHESTCSCHGLLSPSLPPVAASRAGARSRANQPLTGYPNRPSDRLALGQLQRPRHWLTGSSRPRLHLDASGLQERIEAGVRRSGRQGNASLPAQS